ncbi:MAG: sel1 repeat family protein [Alphaproteobacteria bacterium]|nr:sel1 repeat family protein [Alphaproteobacteria bacterium]
MITTIDELVRLDPMNAKAEEILELGLKYCLGQGVQKSLVEAHKWFNISALKGNVAAKSYRCELAQEMSSAEIAEAQRQARALITFH